MGGDGFASVEAAHEFADSVLAPTLIVCSGRGLHCYWLLGELWLLRDDAERAAAAALVQGFQERLRQAAAAVGVSKLDATQDLARLLRPPGSFNAKTQPVVHVELLDDGGPRYELDELRALAVTTAPRLEPPPPSGGERSPESLLKRYPKLARIAHRDGDAPGDGSPSAWDWYLACEARRRVSGLAHAEAIGLLAHARGLHPDPNGKGQRPDYLRRTVDKAFAEVEPPATESGPEEDSPETIGAWISAQWRLRGDNPIVRGWSKGSGENARIHLERRDGSELHFPRLGDFFEAAAHVRRVSIIARSPCPSFTKEQAVRIAQQIVTLCDTREDLEDDRLELGAWLEQFKGGLGRIVPGQLVSDDDAGARWRCSLRSWTSSRSRGPVRPPQGGGRARRQRPPVDSRRRADAARSPLRGRADRLGRAHEPHDRPRLGTPRGRAVGTRRGAPRRAAHQAHLLRRTRTRARGRVHPCPCLTRARVPQ